MLKRKTLIYVVALAFIVAVMVPAVIGCAPEDKIDDTTTLPTVDIEGAPEKIRIGVVTFLSGPASSPFGIPGRSGAEVLVEHLNAGRGPSPYQLPGIGGVPIEMVIIDEAGGAERQVAELRRLILDEKVDFVIGYISSADALAVAPVAEELETLTIIYDAGTHQLFEEAQYKYVFRTKGHQAIDNIGAARYVLELNPDLKTIAGINQDYAWGHDSWQAFRDSILALKPDVEVVAELFPTIYAGEYSAEISSLLSLKPDVIHTSLWGGDMEGYLLQATVRKLQEESLLVFTPGDTMLPRLEANLPPGIVIGARGPHGALGPGHGLDQWFNQIYKERFLIRPVYPAYHMSQAILGVKSAFEKVLAENNGEVWPTIDEVIEAFRYLEFDTPSGVISMAIGGGHQGVEPVPYGITGEDIDPETGERVLEQVKLYPVELVNPPDGVKTLDWIRDGFPTP